MQRHCKRRQKFAIYFFFRSLMFQHLTLCLRLAAPPLVFDEEETRVTVSATRKIIKFYFMPNGSRHRFHKLCRYNAGLKMVLNSSGSTCATAAALVIGIEKADDVDTWKLVSDEASAINERPFLGGCVYRGEGNANLVLALPSERKVVRFRKTSPGEASSDGGLDRITREIEFIRNVISGLLGDYVRPPEAVRCNPEDMVRLSEAIRPLRPKNRCAKEIVEEYATKYVDYAFLPAKMTGIVQQQQQHRGPQLRTRPSFSVEIKPKQGFRHELDQRFKKCTYCLTQYYKVKLDSIESRSGYCPFDLFSGDTERMRKSIRALLESPQNNFKIFNDGVIVYDTNSRPADLESIFSTWFAACNGYDSEQYFELFFRLIRTALLREFPQSRQLRTSPPHGGFTGLSLRGIQAEPRIDPKIVSRAKEILYFLGEECNLEGGNLPRGSVLERVRYMQQLPYHSADAVYEIYTRHLETLTDQAVYAHMINTYRREKQTELLVRNGKRNESLLDQSDPCGDQTLLCKVINYSDNRRRPISERSSNGDDEKTPSDLWNNNSYRKNGDGNAKSSITVEELEALQNYLLATTAKDCAILMAFEEIDATGRPDVTEDYIVEATDQLKFLVNVGVLDLDPKSIHCVEKHRIRDENVLVALKRTFEEGEIRLINQLPPMIDQN